jgi:hypothetical protein
VRKKNKNTKIENCALMDWTKYFKMPEKDDSDKQNFKKFDYEDDDDDFSK